MGSKGEETSMLNAHLIYLYFNFKVIWAVYYVHSPNTISLRQTQYIYPPFLLDQYKYSHVSIFMNHNHFLFLSDVVLAKFRYLVFTKFYPMIIGILKGKSRYFGYIWSKDWLLFLIYKGKYLSFFKIYSIWQLWHLKTTNWLTYEVACFYKN